MLDTCPQNNCIHESFSISVTKKNAYTWTVFNLKPPDTTLMQSETLFIGRCNLSKADGFMSKLTASLMA